MKMILDLIYNIFYQLLYFFIGKGLSTYANLFTVMAITVTLFTALLSATYQLIWVLRQLAPEGVGFFMSLFPSTAPLYIDAYLTAVILKRVYDYQFIVMAQAAQARSETRARLPSRS